MRKALLAVLFLAVPLVAEAQFPGEFIYPRGYRSSDGLVFDIVDATNAALRVNCVAGTGCTGTGDVTSDNANGMFRVAGFYGARENTKVATTTPYAYAFAPAPALAPPQFPGTFGYLRGYTDAAGVFGILDSTNAAVRINCVAGCTGSMTVGNAVTGGGANRVLFEDDSQNLATDAGFIWLSTPTGASATSNFLNITKTLPGTLSAETNAVLIAPTFVTQSQVQTGLKVATVNSGSTVNNGTFAIVGINPQLTSAGGVAFLGALGTTAVANGVYGQVNTNSGYGVGGHFINTATGGEHVGVIGETSATANPTAGVWGNIVNTSSNGAAGFFTITASSRIGTALGSPGIVALLADNGASANNIFCGRDNGTNVLCINDGGTVSTGTGQFTKEFSGNKLNITEASPQAVVRVTLATSASYGALVTYTVRDSDGTDFVVRNGSIQVQGANKAGTTTCTILTTRDQETEDGSSAVVTGGALTLTYTWTNVVNTTSCDLSLNAASNAGANTLDIYWKAIVTTDSTATAITAQ